MSYSTTSTTTWTRTQARHVAGKVAADLRRLSQAYGRPSEEHIEALLGELTEYLAAGYLDRITYGFRRDGRWIVPLRYVAGPLGQLSDDERSGGVDVSANIDGAVWYSHFVGNAQWDALTSAERAAFAQALPVQRSPGEEPNTGSLTWQQDRRYAAGGGSVVRNILR